MRAFRVHKIEFEILIVIYYWMKNGYFRGAKHNVSSPQVEPNGKTLSVRSET